MITRARVPDVLNEHPFLILRPVISFPEFRQNESYQGRIVS